MPMGYFDQSCKFDLLDRPLALDSGAAPTYTELTSISRKEKII
jgi:hypothetical protein